ncbi:MAG: hypothetical protein IMW89_18235 [Ktedonobacteraceae bacterium]|nr:hypothetical protein [Ktedonobacteraceae bacterium]
MYPFEEYLRRHRLEALTVSIAAKVRYLTVWNAIRGNPITPEQAHRIRQAVLSMTGLPYTGPLPLLHIKTSQDMPAITMKQIKQQISSEKGHSS